MIRSNVSIIFDAPCLFSIQCLYVFHMFHMFSFIFRMFSYTNILTRCPRLVAVFCMLFVSEILLRKYSRNGLKIHGDQSLPGTKTETEGDPEGGRGQPKAPQAKSHPRPRLMVLSGPWPPLPVTSSPIRCP